MQTDYLIIGQGICGTFLSKYITDAGKKVIVVDEEQCSASRICSGVINPVTGRRIVRTWMIEKLMAFAFQAYSEWSAMTGRSVIKELSVIDFHPTLQMQQAFLDRQSEDNEFLSEERDPGKWKQQFNFQFGAGKIAPCFLIDILTVLDYWRNELKKEHILIEDEFLWEDCTFDNERIIWKNVEAKKIILCNGAFQQKKSPFSLLPFANNKGEAVIAEIPDLPTDNIYKQSLSIVPWQNGLFWIGSTYKWNYQNVLPDPAFTEKVRWQLDNWLKIPYKILEHFAAERPATIERRPFVGLHPLYPSVGVLNGMGTKGCSLAPYFAKQLADHLTSNTPIDPSADVKRFSKVLSLKL